MLQQHVSKYKDFIIRNLVLETEYLQKFRNIYNDKLFLLLG